MDEASAGDRYLAASALEETDRRRLRRALWIAAAAHGALLLIQAPAPPASIVAAESRPIPHFLEPTIFLPRETPPEPLLPRPRARRVPMPDPTPDAPEPERVAEVERIASDAIGELELVVPPAPPEPEIEDILPVGGEVTRPVKLFAPAPAYTEVARRARIQGVVAVQAIIDRDGNVVSAEILRGLPMGLGEATLEAVRTWRFRPATLRGRPVAVTFTLEVRFELG